MSQRPKVSATSMPIPKNALRFTDPIDMPELRETFRKSISDVAETGSDIFAVSTKWRSKIPVEFAEELAQCCNSNHLYKRGEASASLGTSMMQDVRLSDFVGSSVPQGALEPTPEQSTLRSVLIFREELTQRSKQVLYSDRQKKVFKSMPSLPKPPAEKVSFVGPHFHPQDAEGQKTLPDELVFTVRVYKPCMSLTSKPTILGEYVLLGCHSLADLRDMIICDFDYSSLAGDMSCDPSMISKGIPLSKDRYPSGYFFFENTFYDDLRHSEAKSLSECVVEYARSHGHESFKRSENDIAHTKIGSLTLKIGYPYLYVHQGNCEHLVVITDARVFNPTSDCQFVGCYPFVKQRRRHYRRPCMCCWRLCAKWAVSNCSLCPEDPTLICGSCLDRLLYSEDKQKIPEAGNFSLYALPSVTLSTPISTSDIKNFEDSDQDESEEPDAL